LDENFQTYLNRAMRLTLPETYQSQAQHLQESAKFRPDPGTGRQPVPFPGYSVIAPPMQDDPENRGFYAELAAYQQQILTVLGDQLLIPVPKESFHLTLADLIWDSTYRHASQENPDFEPQLQAQIAQIFQQSGELTEGKPLQFQILGLMVMTRAIGVCLSPTDPRSHDRLLKFRSNIYQTRELMGLGIEQQYYFTPHITLGYFGDIPPADQLSQLSEQFDGLNQRWIGKDPQEFRVQRAELRKFDDMTRYYRQTGWPTLEF
jgi:hypothetical protein